MILERKHKSIKNVGENALSRDVELLPKSGTCASTKLTFDQAAESIKAFPHICRLGHESFRTDGYMVNKMSKFGDESTIKEYVRELGREKDYTILYKLKLLSLF